MREIEFRGKRADNGEWVYGSLTIAKIGVLKTVIWEEVGYDESYGLGVEPETVGEYTGLKDRNGVKIFEGDIVKNGLSGTWKVGPLDGGSFDLYGIDKEYKDKCFLISALNSQCEVVGNIHDNPELLEEGRE